MLPVQRNNFGSPLIWVLNWNSAAAFCQAWKQKLISMTQASGGELCQVISLRLCYSGSITVLIHTYTQPFPESLAICGAFNYLLLGFSQSRATCREGRRLPLTSPFLLPMEGWYNSGGWFTCSSPVCWSLPLIKQSSGWERMWGRGFLLLQLSDWPVY